MYYFSDDEDDESSSDSDSDESDDSIDESQPAKIQIRGETFLRFNIIFYHLLPP